MKKPLFSILFIVFFITLDQITKYLAETLISPFEPIKILPFLQLVNVRNEGAAFGLLSSMGNKFFITVSFAAIGVITFLLFKDKDSRLGLCLLLSGALGNLIDRLLFGHVRDFMDVFVGSFHWPAFNVADSCLTIGVILLIAMPAFRHRKRVS